jgi:hypothetical protein
MFDAPLKLVQTMRLKSLATGCPSEKRSSLGTTVQPRRTPVNPAYFENDAVSIATYIKQTRVTKMTSNLVLGKYYVLIVMALALHVRQNAIKSMQYIELKC